MAVPPLTGNSSNLLFEIQERSQRLDSVLYKQERGDRKSFVLRRPTGSCSVSLSGKGSSCVLCDEEEGAVPLLVLCHPLVRSSL